VGLGPRNAGAKIELGLDVGERAVSVELGRWRGRVLATGEEGREQEGSDHG
jgi:hypothetical protein